MYGIWFYGSDGEFEYFYGTARSIEGAMRTPRFRRLTWTFDGDGFSSENTIFHEAGKEGSWLVTRTR